LIKIPLFPFPSIPSVGKHTSLKLCIVTKRNTGYYLMYTTLSDKAAANPNIRKKPGGPCLKEK